MFRAAWEECRVALINMRRAPQRGGRLRHANASRAGGKDAEGVAQGRRAPWQGPQAQAPGWGPCLSERRFGGEGEAGPSGAAEEGGEDEEAGPRVTVLGEVGAPCILVWGGEVVLKEVDCHSPGPQQPHTLQTGCWARSVR